MRVFRCTMSVDSPENPCTALFANGGTLTVRCSSDRASRGPLSALRPGCHETVGLSRYSVSAPYRLLVQDPQRRRYSKKLTLLRCRWMLSNTPTAMKHVMRLEPP